MAQWDQIDVDGSPMRLYVGMPSLGRAFPAVIVIQHGPGVDRFIQDRVVLQGGRNLQPGTHDVAVSFGLVIPYLQSSPDGPLTLPFRIERPLVLDATATVPSVSRDVA